MMPKEKQKLEPKEKQELESKEKQESEPKEKQKVITKQQGIKGRPSKANIQKRIDIGMQIIKQANYSITKERFLKKYKARLKALEKASEEALEKMSKEASEKVSKETSEKVSKETSEKVSKEASEKVSKETSEKVSKETSEKVSKEASEKVSKETPKKTSKGTSKEKIEKFVCPTDDGTINRDIDKIVAQIIKQQGTFNFKDETEINIEIGDTICDSIKQIRLSIYGYNHIIFRANKTKLNSPKSFGRMALKKLKAELPLERIQQPQKTQQDETPQPPKTLQPPNTSMVHLYIIFNQSGFEHYVSSFYKKNFNSVLYTSSHDCCSEIVFEYRYLRNILKQTYYILKSYY